MEETMADSPGHLFGSTDGFEGPDDVLLVLVDFILNLLNLPQGNSNHGLQKIPDRAEPGTQDGAAGIGQQLGLCLS